MSGLYALIAAMVQGSHPHAWSISNSAFFPKSGITGPHFRVEHLATSPMVNIPFSSSFFCIPSADSPKISQWPVRPQRPAIGHFVQLSDADAMAVCRHMLRHNIHGYLAEEQVCPDPSGCRDAGCLKNIQNDFPGKVAGREPVGGQVVCDIHEHLVDGVDDDVLRRDILHVNLHKCGYCIPCSMPCGAAQ